VESSGDIVDCVGVLDVAVVEALDASRGARTESIDAIDVVIASILSSRLISAWSMLAVALSLVAPLPGPSEFWASD